MSVIGAFFLGFQRVLARPQWVVLKLAVNLLFAWLLTLPVRMALHGDLDHSVAADAWARNISLYDEARFWAAHAAEWAANAPLQVALLILFGLINLYLSGGILASYQRPAELPSKGFFATCASRFFPLVLVLCGVALLKLIFILLPFSGLFYAFDALEDGFAGPKYRYWLVWSGTVLILLFGASYVWRVYDMARARVCQADEQGQYPSVIRAFLGSWLLATRFYPSSLILWLLYMGALAALWPLAGMLRGLTQPLSLGNPLVETAFAQIIVLGQVVVGLAMPAGWGAFADARRAVSWNKQNDASAGDGDADAGRERGARDETQGAVAAAAAGGVASVAAGAMIEEAASEPSEVLPASADGASVESPKVAGRKRDPHDPPEEEIDFDDDAYQMWDDG